MTAGTDQPIEELIECTSLGSRHVRVFASHAPLNAVAEVVRQVAKKSSDRTRAFSANRTYSSTKNTNPSQDKGVGATMAKTEDRRTGQAAGKAASKVLRDGRTGRASKTAAGSALSQRAPRPPGSRSGGRSAKRK
jgi:hypothetical protein